jgi:pimeloyl-ACP methyl ester carboxylesterase
MVNCRDARRTPAHKARAMGYPRLDLRRRSLWAAIVIVALTAATFAVISTGKAPASARTASNPRPESALVHRLATCLPHGHAKPTVVLVHGAFADASSWSSEVATLHAAGYDVRAIANPLQNLTTDSEYVTDYVKTIHGPVVLAGHSYGGSVITNAAAGLENVKRLVFVDAAAPAPGQTTAQLSGAGSVLTKKKPAELFFTTAEPNSGAPELYLKASIFIRNFASDLPPAKAKVLWASQRGTATAALATPSMAAAWKTIPSWYFISTGDQIITPASELAMAHRAHSHIVRFSGGSHLTLISHPNAVTAVIAAAICSLR